MNIKPYDEKYRDDLIFMVLQAKDALGRRPTINEDLFDIRANYINRGDMFWIAVDDNDRVVGCIGYSRITDTTEAFIHRLYVKATEKRKGITISRIHLGSPKEQWFESYSFYPKHGYHEYEKRYMLKIL